MVSILKLLKHVFFHLQRLHKLSLVCGMWCDNLWRSLLWPAHKLSHTWLYISTETYSRGWSSRAWCQQGFFLWGLLSLPCKRSASPCTCTRYSHHTGPSQNHFVKAPISIGCHILRGWRLNSQYGATPVRHPQILLKALVWSPECTPSPVLHTRSHSKGSSNGGQDSTRDTR